MESTSRPKKKIVIVEDHPVVRKGMAQLINGSDDLVVVGEAEDAHGALEVIARQEPHAAVVDISLKDSSGMELLKDLAIRWPKLPVLVFSMHDETAYAERVLRLGARGYVSKDERPVRVLEGLRQILAGEVFVSARVAGRFLSKLAGDTRTATATDGLTDREFQIFGLLGEGLELKDIADRLHLSVKTVETHRESLKRKLGADSATELLRRAIEWVRFEGDA